MLVAMLTVFFVVGATLYALQAATNAQIRQQAYSDEITTTQGAVARLLHDLRQASRIVFVEPYAVEFQMAVTQVTNGVSHQVTLDILYQCNAPDSLGSGYTRCARVQSVDPNPLPAVTSTPGPGDIQHVINGGSTVYCNTNGSAASGSIFFPQNASTTNPDVSPPACDENYEAIVAAQPSFLQVLIQVPASGDLSGRQKATALQHTTTFSGGAFIRNWNLDA
jgi:hypothetical protein